MSSSVRSFRRIASNRLWTPQGVVRNPLLTLSAEGRVVAVTTCDEPDRQPCVEFYAGLLVPGFPADYVAAFDRMCAQRDISLSEQLEWLVKADAPTLVVISGLDYDTMRLTSASCIRNII